MSDLAASGKRGRRAMQACLSCKAGGGGWVYGGCGGDSRKDELSVCDWLLFKSLILLCVLFDRKGQVTPLAFRSGAFQLLKFAFP